MQKQMVNNVNDFFISRRLIEQIACKKLSIFLKTPMSLLKDIICGKTSTERKNCLFLPFHTKSLPFIHIGYSGLVLVC